MLWLEFLLKRLVGFGRLWKFLLSTKTRCKKACLTNTDIVPALRYAYFVPSKSAKTSKVPLPPISDRTRRMFQERLSSCLTKLLGVEMGARSTFAFMIVGMIKSKSDSSKSLDLAFKADAPVMKTLEQASLTLDAISAKVRILLPNRLLC
jgi:hypothetical protein